VHVTHDQEEAMAIADRIVVMSGGRIADQGPPREVYLRPKSLFSAGFMGEVNKVPVKGGEAAFGPVAVPDGVLCIRPEAISEGGSLRLGPCRVVETVFFGTHLRAHVVPVAAPGLRLVVHLPQGAEVAVGAVMDLGATDFVVLEA
jgi:spermidine/putrescine transport system ATP-binding protein